MFFGKRMEKARVIMETTRNKNKRLISQSISLPILNTMIRLTFCSVYSTRTTYHTHSQTVTTNTKQILSTTNGVCLSNMKVCLSEAQLCLSCFRGTHSRNTREAQKHTKKHTQKHTISTLYKAYITNMYITVSTVLLYIRLL